MNAYARQEVIRCAAMEDAEKQAANLRRALLGEMTTYIEKTGDRFRHWAVRNSFSTDWVEKPHARLRKGKKGWRFLHVSERTGADPDSREPTSIDRALIVLETGGFAGLPSSIVSAVLRNQVEPWSHDPRSSRAQGKGGAGGCNQGRSALQVILRR